MSPRSSIVPSRPQSSLVFLPVRMPWPSSLVPLSTCPHAAENPTALRRSPLPFASSPNACEHQAFSRDPLLFPVPSMQCKGSEEGRRARRTRAAAQPSPLSPKVHLGLGSGHLCLPPALSPFLPFRAPTGLSSLCPDILALLISRTIPSCFCIIFSFLMCTCNEHPCSCFPVAGPTGLC